MFPAETNKVGEMEFYLLEDLDFHLTIFHPYRSLLHILGREPADPGKFPKSRVDEDAEIERIKKKKEDDAKKPALNAGRLGVPGTSIPVVEEMSGGAWDESEEARIRRLMGRGSGEGLMEIDEGVLQICL
jgi:cyclin C